MITYLLIALVALQAADTATTWLALSRGVGREANPLMASLFSRFGWRGPLLLAKLFVAAWFVGCNYLVNRLQAGLTGVWLQVASITWLCVLLLTAGGYCYVVWGNVQVLRK